MRGRSQTFRHQLTGLAVLLALTTLSLLSPVSLAQNTGSSLFAPSQPRFLDVDDAFRYYISLNERETFTIHWDIAPGYYLYADKFAVTLPNEAQGQQPDMHMPAGQPHVDEYFGEIDVFYDQVVLTVDLPPALVGKNTTLLLHFQGCADAGLCYPPEQREIDIWQGSSE